MSVTTPIIKDEDYYLEPMFILVEDTMFQVPKCHFTNISIFSTMFSLPSPKENEIEGLSEKLPLALRQISKQDFKSFLKVLIPLQIPPNYSSIKKEEWISALKLSTMWDVSSLRKLSIENLKPKLNAVGLILLGSDYHISPWFVNGCVTLITRIQGPTEEEGGLLGMRTTVNIYGIRERFLSSGRPISQFDFNAALRNAFPEFQQDTSCN